MMLERETNPSYSQELGKAFCWRSYRTWKKRLLDQVGIPVPPSFIALFGWLRKKNLFRKTLNSSICKSTGQQAMGQMNRNYKIKRFRDWIFHAKETFFFNLISICCRLLLLVLLNFFVVLIFFIIVIIILPVYLNQHLHYTSYTIIILLAACLFMTQIFYDVKILQFLLAEEFHSCLMWQSVRLCLQPKRTLKRVLKF